MHHTIDSIQADLKKLEQSRPGNVAHARQPSTKQPAAPQPQAEQTEGRPVVPKLKLQPAPVSARNPQPQKSDHSIARNAKIVNLEGELTLRSRALDGAYASMQILEDDLIDTDELQADLDEKTAALEVANAALAEVQRQVSAREGTIEALKEQLITRVGTLEGELTGRIESLQAQLKSSAAAMRDATANAQESMSKLSMECTRVKFLEGRLLTTEEKLVATECQVCELKGQLVVKTRASSSMERSVERSESMSEEREGSLVIRIKELEHILSTKNSDAEAARQAHAQALRSEKQHTDKIELEHAQALRDVEREWQGQVDALNTQVEAASGSAMATTQHAALEKLALRQQVATAETEASEAKAQLVALGGGGRAEQLQGQLLVAQQQLQDQRTLSNQNLVTCTQTTQQKSQLSERVAELEEQLAATEAYAETEREIRNRNRMERVEANQVEQQQNSKLTSRISELEGQLAAMEEDAALQRMKQHCSEMEVKARVAADEAQQRISELEMQLQMAEQKLETGFFNKLASARRELEASRQYPQQDEVQTQGSGLGSLKY